MRVLERSFVGFIPGRHVTARLVPPWRGVALRVSRGQPEHIQNFLAGEIRAHREAVDEPIDHGPLSSLSRISRKFFREWLPGAESPVTK